jgi:hypothetical protein
MTDNFKEIEIIVETKDQGWASVQDSNSYFDLRLTKDGTLISQKQRIISNYKESSFKRKTFVLKKNDPFICDLTFGNTLELVARSEYPGWQNYVRYAKINFIN